MAKRKAPRPAAAGPKELDPADAKLRITSFEDVADSEEEYYLEKDRIDLDDEPTSKRQRRLEREEQFLEASDEEVLGYDSEEEEEEPAKRGRAKKDDDEEDDEDEKADEKEDLGWWGSSRKEYYDADQIETEADALEEEAEARRLQQQKLAKMDEADFLFDGEQWLGESEAAGGVAVDVSQEISTDMAPEDRYKLLQARYPEFDYLADEFRSLQPRLAACQQDATGRPSRSLEVVKHRVLGAYVASLASYFAVLTAPARDQKDARKTLDPAELRDHDIMQTLMECRAAWSQVEGLRPRVLTAAALSAEAAREEAREPARQEAVGEVRQEADKASKEARARKKQAAEKARRAQAVEDSLADLSGLLKRPKLAKSTTRKAASDEETGHSDFGEEDAMDARTAADKARRKKSLRFYTSQIVQKSNRRAGAGRDAGGDADIPYRERLKDRQARLLAAAEKRGQQGSKHGADLGGDDEDEDEHGGDDGDADYYNTVSAAAQQKKETKAARQEAVAAAKKGERVVEHEEVGEDGKRRVTYAIEKNKGLTPKRKNELRNPRVKKRLRFAEKQKKLKSMRPVYQGGEGRGGYQGELSGIRTGLVKSVKF